MTEGENDAPSRSGGRSSLPVVSADGGRTLRHLTVVTLSWAGLAHGAQLAAAGILRIVRKIQATFRLAYFTLPVAPIRTADIPVPVSVSPTQPRARIIANLLSGGARGSHALSELRETAQWLAEHGMPVEICPTTYPGHAAELASEAVRLGMDMVIAAGGDGTVNSVIQALAGHPTALGVLPMGTMNVWAREMNIPLNLADARRVLLEGSRRRVDLGRAGSRYFLMMAGIGLDAEVARRVERSWLQRLGLKLIDYIATVGLLSITHQPARIWIRRDGKRRAINALMIIIGNTRLYAGAFEFTGRAIADDGWLDVVAIGGGGISHRFTVFLRAVLRRKSFGPRVKYSRCHTVRLESSVPVPVQVDGEVIGTLPMTFSIAPAMLTVVVPRTVASDLFSRPDEVAAL